MAEERSFVMRFSGATGLCPGRPEPVGLNRLRIPVSRPLECVLEDFVGFAQVVQPRRGNRSSAHIIVQTRWVDGLIDSCCLELDIGEVLGQAHPSGAVDAERVGADAVVDADDGAPIRFRVFFGIDYDWLLGLGCPADLRVVAAVGSVDHHDHPRS